MNNCTCPYCDKTMDDPDECYEVDTNYEQECPHCGKIFVFTVGYIRTYNEAKAPCLNGAEHEYKPTTTYPVEFTKMECAYCGDRRDCTDEELAQVLGERGK